eukprot:scaffold142554_cov90-Phaeocystis_antarctica.AAC.1
MDGTGAPDSGVRCWKVRFRSRGRSGAGAAGSAMLVLLSITMPCIDHHHAFQRGRGGGKSMVEGERDVCGAPCTAAPPVGLRGSPALVSSLE